MNGANLWCCRCPVRLQVDTSLRKTSWTSMEVRMLHATRLRPSHLIEGDKRNQHRNGKPVPQDQAMLSTLNESLVMPVSTALSS